MFLVVATATARPLASVTPTPTAWRLEGTGGRAPGSPAPSSQVAGAAVGRAGIRGVWQMAPAMDISRSTPLGRSMPCVEALALPSPVPQPRMARLSLRSDAQIMAAQLGLSRSDRIRPVQSNPRLPCLGSQPAHQPSVYGMAWVGWRDHKAPWMAPYEPPWTGSRRVPPPHPRRPASHQAGMQPLPLPSASASVWRRSRPPRHLPPQPAEHLPRYTQAIASPPGPLKPSNINGLKGKSAP